MSETGQGVYTSFGANAKDKDTEGYCGIPFKEPAFIKEARTIPGISERVLHILDFSRIKGRRMKIKLDANNRIILNTKGRISIFPKKKDSKEIVLINKREKSPYKRSDKERPSCDGKRSFFISQKTRLCLSHPAEQEISLAPKDRISPLSLSGKKCYLHQLPHKEI